MRNTVFQKCINPACGGTADFADTGVPLPEVRRVGRCRLRLELAFRFPNPASHFEGKWTNRNNALDFSGVWRFRELLPFSPESHIVTIGEGQTLCQRADAVAAYAGLNAGRLFLQYEGMNPSGSFKDNGMCAAFTHARATGAKRAACASTGNTSASLAIYCAATQLMRGVIFIGSGKISYGKLSQALEHGAADTSN